MGGHKRLPDIVAHLESPRPDTRPQPGHRAFCSTSAQGAQDGFGDTMAASPRQPPPARMGGGNGAALRVDQQHRQAVRHHDRAGDARHARDAGIGHTGGHLFRVPQAGDRSAMHLLQEHRRGLQAGSQMIPVGLHCSRVISHMVAQV